MSVTLNVFDWQSASALQTGVLISLLVLGGSLIYSRIQRKEESSYDVPPVPEKPEKSNDCVILVIGAGTIGSSFASVFLSQGKKVHVCDPFVTKERMEKRIREYWPFLVSRGITTIEHPPLETALTKTESWEDALAEIQKRHQTIEFVQESSWEDVDHKQKLFGELDKHLDPSILIASSTSFITWTLLVPQVKHKHRIFIGHPSIPHLGSFLEVYGSDPAWTHRCKEWYSSVAFDVIVMKRTIPGHVFNSFLRVNMTHGTRLIRNGVCSPEDVNTALRHLGRSFYGGHTFLSLLIAIGGDRGLEGGRELERRIRKDAVYLILYSGMKQKTPLPDFMVRPLSRCLGGIIDSLLPGFPNEYGQAVEEFERLLTKDGTISTQVALQQASSNIHGRMPLEVGNDPFSRTESLKIKQAA